MKTKIILLICFFTLTQTVFAQKKMPIIKANSKLMDIKDGKKFLKGVWTIVPEAKPDIYTTSSKTVTFYTDIDSITIKVDPKVGKYNFIVLLNGKDTAWTQVKYQLPYLEILKKANQYNYADNRFIPKFEYQSGADSNLVRIRKALQLDSIAGNGNEISKIISLMHWVHNAIKHDGNSYNPTLKNAIELIEICKKEQRGVNCRMLATILNECYLAVGIKSRFVTCLPKDTADKECHVINMVYCNDLKKWIWMDPTNDAYVIDEKGDILGLEEVRQRLINGKPLIINPDANWNRQMSIIKSQYLYNYMAKNLYRLETALVSEYDTETAKKGKTIAYVELLPLDGVEQTPQKKEFTNEKTGVKYINYKTNNPNIFWAKPN